MNAPKTKPIAVPLAVVTLLLTVVVFCSANRPKSDSPKPQLGSDANLSGDTKTAPATDSSTPTVRTVLPASSESIVTNSIGMQLIRIPIGEFWMGSPAGESGRWEGEHRHRVGITKSFYIGLHEVTVGQFQQFVNATAYYV